MERSVCQSVQRKKKAALSEKDGPLFYVISRLSMPALGRDASAKPE
jgi:hypothetical protein